MDQRLIEQLQWTNLDSKAEGDSLDSRRHYGLGDRSLALGIRKNRHRLLKQRMQLLEKKVGELTEQLSALTVSSYAAWPGNACTAICVASFF